MGSRHSRLQDDPERFEALAGISPADFDRLLDEVRPRVRAAEVVRLGRVGRRRAIGGGPPFGLDLSDQVLMALIRIRHRPTLGGLGDRFGISLWTAMRALHRLTPILAALRPELDHAPRGHQQGDELVRALLDG